MKEYIDFIREFIKAAKPLMKAEAGRIMKLGGSRDAVDGYDDLAIYADKHFAAIEAGIIQIQALQNPWVPIADIPEEWKDGRKIDLTIETIDGTHRCANCEFKGGKWWRRGKGPNTDVEISEFATPEDMELGFYVIITYAMLPIDTPAKLHDVPTEREGGK